MADHTEYFWVVLCKNHCFHRRQNLYFGHSIPLAETDAILPPPPVYENLFVRCDDCGQEYSYGPREILRAEFDPPHDFKPHPLFARTEKATKASSLAIGNSDAAGTIGQ